MDSKKGILISVGELFLKSKQVRNLFQRRLLNNIKFFLKKEKIDFSLFSFRERIFIETEKTKKAKRVLKKVFGIAWLSESFFLPKAGLEDISGFVARNYKSWIKRGESFAIFLKRGGEIKEKNRPLILAETLKIFLPIPASFQLIFGIPKEKNENATKYFPLPSLPLKILPPANQSPLISKPKPCLPRPRADRRPLSLF